MADHKKQIDKFKDAARELECDDDETHFKKRLGSIAKPRNSGAARKPKSETPGGP